MNAATSDSPATRPEATGIVYVSEFFRFHFCQPVRISAQIKNENEF